MSHLNRSLISLLVSVLLVSISGCHPSSYLFEQFAQEEKGWVLLEETKVNHIREKDVLKIKGNQKFTSLRLYVRNRDIDIHDLEVHMISGDILKPAIEKEVKRGERSRVIELAADGRQLDYITIRYRSKGAWFTKRATVLFVGKQYNPNGAY